MRKSKAIYQPDWIRVSDCPFSKAYTYRLIKKKLLESALFDALGLGRGVRLISRRSLEELLSSPAFRLSQSRPVGRPKEAVANE